MPKSVMFPSDGPPGPVIRFDPRERGRACPIKASLGALGHKWTLIVLRDIAFTTSTTFGEMLKRSPGLTPRVLSARLAELRAEGLIEKVADATDDRVFHYRLTEAGKDTIPVMSAIIAFGMKHRANVVFEDGRPRTMGDQFPGRAYEFLGDLYEFARQDVVREGAEGGARGGSTATGSARTRRFPSGSLSPNSRKPKGLVRSG